MVAAALSSAGVPVVVVNPAQVRAFARALGKRRHDRRRRDRPLRGSDQEARRARPLPDAETQRLADLLARRRQIIDMIGAERQREKRASPAKASCA